MSLVTTDTVVRVSASQTIHNPVQPQDMPQRRNSAGSAFFITWNDAIPQARIVPLSISENPKMNEDITVVGYPLGRADMQLTKGTATGRIFNHVQISAAVNPGNSGGPAINVDGRAVGVVVSGMSEANGMSFIVPFSVINTIVPDKIKNTKPVLLTAYHVVENCSKIYLQGAFKGKAHVIWACPEADIAILIPEEYLDLPCTTIFHKLPFISVLLERTDPAITSLLNIEGQCGARCRALFVDEAISDKNVALKPGDILTHITVGENSYEVDNNSMINIPEWDQPVLYTVAFERCTIGSFYEIKWTSPPADFLQSSALIARSDSENFSDSEISSNSEDLEDTPSVHTARVFPSSTPEAYLTSAHPEMNKTRGYEFVFFAGCVISQMNKDILFGSKDIFKQHAHYFSLPCNMRNTFLCLLGVGGNCPLYTNEDYTNIGMSPRYNIGSQIKALNGHTVSTLHEFQRIAQDLLAKAVYFQIELENGYILGAPCATIAEYEKSLKSRPTNRDEERARIKVCLERIMVLLVEQ